VPHGIRKHEIDRRPVVVNRMRRVPGGAHPPDPGDELLDRDAANLPAAEHRQHMPAERQLVALIRPR